MQNLQTLRKKLASTHNIKHITEAIELVASVRLQKLMQKIEHFRFFSNQLRGIVENLTHAVDDHSHPLFDVRDVKTRGVIIIAADKGLCGSYNANVIKQADHFLEQANTPQKLILFGQKSVDYFSKRGHNVLSTHVNYGSKINETHVRDWCAEISRAFEKKELDEVWVVYTHYKNVLSRETRVKKILPMEKKDSENETPEKSDYIYEPDVKAIYEKIIPSALYTELFSLLLESQASELSSRVVSMKTAATNADEMITKLTLIKNKIRQFGITEEILEINAGAEGIS